MLSVNGLLSLEKELQADLSVRLRVLLQEGQGRLKSFNRVISMQVKTTIKVSSFNSVASMRVSSTSSR